jgi:adenylate cyclase
MTYFYPVARNSEEARGSLRALLSLVMNPGLPDEQTFPMAIGSSTIGRTKDNDVFCLHKSLSRKHAKLEFDGSKIRITDLMSKNGIFFNGKRVTKCEVVEGDTFRCGDITFLVESATTRAPRVSAPAQTLPSPLAMAADGLVGQKKTARMHAPAVIVEDDQRYKDKLFVLIRASELLVGELSIDRFLDEMIVLAVQVVEVDRIGLLTLDETTLEIKPRVLKTFVGAAPRPYSKRVVDWVIDHGSPASWANVSLDKSLGNDPHDDTAIKGAMCVPVNPGGGTIGVLYADSVSRVDCFRPDDLALMRALANLLAIGIETDALRRQERVTLMNATTR